MLSKDDKEIQASKYDVNISRSLPYMLNEIREQDGKTVRK
jgi:hypothetical protein